MYPGMWNSMIHALNQIEECKEVSLDLYKFCLTQSFYQEFNNLLIQPTALNKAKKILVVGPLGAGKSTILNSLNSESRSAFKKVFKSSNALIGCTQEFDSTIAEIAALGSVALYDSPGLADPNFPIDRWTTLYNKDIACQKLKFELLVCVMEYAERPSNKEL